MRADETLSRRRFFSAVAALGVAAQRGREAAAEPPPEATTLRISYPGLCMTPMFAAEALLRTEGFTDVQYRRDQPTGSLAWRALASGETHLTMAFSAPLLIQIERGDPIVVLAGIHAGCFELVGSERVRSVRDLKGKTVAVQALEGAPHILISLMVAYVGVDPRKDIKWVILPNAAAKQQLAAGKIDAFYASPPDAQELRAKKVGRVLVNSNLDRPWSQYFCCTLVANREFVNQHPVATKRALRAILKASDICAADPERVVDLLVSKGYVTQREHALQGLKDTSYRWRQYDIEDTVRFWALRLHQAGMIRATPQRIMAQGVEWRFLNELKRELKS
jgi:NitT/TauT family transport system substrate-binding protein